MSKDEFLRAAKAFLVDRVGDDAAAVDEQTNLVGAGILDSLMLLEFFFFLEEQKGSALDTDVVSQESLATLGAAYDLIAA